MSCKVNWGTLERTNWIYLSEPCSCPWISSQLPSLKYPIQSSALQGEKGFLSNGKGQFFHIQNEFEKSTLHRKNLNRWKGVRDCLAGEPETSVKLKAALSEQREAMEYSISRQAEDRQKSGQEDLLGTEKMQTVRYSVGNHSPRMG